MIDIPNDIEKLMLKLEKHGYTVHIVGGAIRDFLLDKEPHDWDLFTNATGEQILSIFPRGKVIGGEERQAKILTVIVDGIEISQYRANGDRTETGSSLKIHQSTCDFTMNSIACNRYGVIDVKNENNVRGIYDLRKKIISFVGKPYDRIKEDPLRILRGLRFMLKYQFSMDEKTHNAIVSYGHYLTKLSKERIRDEIIKCLPFTRFFIDLTMLNLIKYIVPEWESVIGVKGGDHHGENVDQHLLNVHQVSTLITDDWRIHLSAFLHDIGKGKTLTEEDGEIHFYQHENVGADIVENWMTEYKFSNDDIKFVTTLVKYHMWSYKAGDIKKKTYINMFNKFNEANITIYDFIMLIYSDHQGNMRKKRIKFADFIKESWVLNRYWECVHQKEPFDKHQLELQGGDILKILGGQPGKWIGDLMDKMFEAVMNDEVTNDRLELVKWIKSQ